MVVPGEGVGRDRYTRNRSREPPSETRDTGDSQGHGDVITQLRESSEKLKVPRAHCGSVLLSHVIVQRDSKHN